MRLKYVILMAVFLLVKSNCYAQINGTVVDAETGQPVGGAVVLAEWTVTRGLPGMSYHEIHKSVEVETGNNGNFYLPATHDPLANPPKVVIYKTGYVAWRNDYIFPAWSKRTDFKYRDGIVVRLEIFREKYSHLEHIDFIEYGIMSFYELPVTELPKIRMGIKTEKQLARP